MDNPIQATALLKSAIKMRRAFPWGTIINTHTVGPYMIFEYVEDMHTGNAKQISFQPYVQDGTKWQDTRHTFRTLDEALVHAVAYRAEGPNTHAAGYFIRGLDRS